MFNAIKNKIKPFKKLNIDDLMLLLSKDNEFTGYAISLNIYDQLYDRGIDSKGESLGEYSTYTKLIKEEKGQITDHITLRDTGEFYNSFKFVLTSNYDFGFSYNSFKGAEEKDLLKIFGEDIIGLTEENLSLLVSMAREKIKLIIRKKIVG